MLAMLGSGVCPSNKPTTSNRPPSAMTSCQRKLRMLKGSGERSLGRDDDVEQGQDKEQDAQPNGDVEDQLLDAAAHVVPTAAKVTATQPAQAGTPALQQNHDDQCDGDNHQSQITIG